MCRLIAPFFLSLILTAGRTSTAQLQEKRSLTRATGVLAAEELFKRVSPSVFLIEALDEKGATIATGSAVVIASNELATNKHVTDEGRTFRVRQNGKM
jgi:hypothetical protein